MAAVATNRAQTSSASDLSSYTFSTVACGAEAAGRRIVVCVHLRFVGTTGDVSSVTVNGNTTAFVDKARNTLDSNTTFAGIYEIVEPTGTTCDVVVNTNTAAVRCGIEVYDVVGAGAASTVHGNSTASNPTATLDVPVNGCAIGCASNNINGVTWTATNITEDYDYIVEVANAYTSAHTNSASGSTVFTFTPSSSNRQAGVFAAWGPTAVIEVDQIWAGGLSDDGLIVAADLTSEFDTNIVVALAADVSFTSPVFTGSTVAATLTDKVGGEFWYTVKHTVTGLSPSTAYRYCLKNSGSIVTGSTGTFTTSPSEGAAAAFSFCFGSCSDTRISTTLETFQGMTNESGLLFFLHLGDLSYDDYVGTDVKEKREATRFTRLHRGNATIAPLYLQTPVFYTWSDHDSAANDNTKSSSIPGTTYDDVMARSMTVYQETVPHLPLTASCGIAQSWRVGKCAFIMPDCYLNRDSAGPMLGATQTAWVISEVQSAVDDGCTLIFLISSATWTDSPYLGWRSTWSTEQSNLLNSIKTISGIPGICVIEGDAHKIGADDGTNTDFSTGGGMKIVRILSSPFLQDSLSGAGASSWNGVDTSNATNNRVYCRIDVNANNDGFVATFKGRNGAGSLSTIASYTTDDLGDWVRLASAVPPDPITSEDLAQLRRHQDKLKEAEQKRSKNKRAYERNLRAATEDVYDMLAGIDPEGAAQVAAVIPAKAMAKPKRHAVDRLAPSAAPAIDWGALTAAHIARVIREIEVQAARLAREQKQLAQARAEAEREQDRDLETVLLAVHDLDAQTLSGGLRSAVQAAQARAEQEAAERPQERAQEHANEQRAPDMRQALASLRDLAGSISASLNAPVEIIKDRAAGKLTVRRVRSERTDG